MSNKIDLSGGKQQLRPHGINDTKDGLKAHSRSYPDAATRLTGADVGTNDIGTTALQEDDNTQWLLTSITPVTWQAVGNPIYTNSTPMPTAVGGLEATTTFSGMSLDDLLTGLLYPYQYPAFSAFAMAGQSTPVEVGASLLVDPNFSWTPTNTSNIAAGSLEIVNVTGGMTVLATGLNHGDSPHGVTLAAITKTTATSHVFRITGTNSKAGTFTRDATYAWQWRSFYGESASAALNEAGVEGLRVKALASGFAGTYVFVEDILKYKYVAYAAALGLATTFKDQSTNLDIPMEAAATVSVANAYGETTRTNYNVHRTTNLIGGAVNIVVS